MRFIATFFAFVFAATASAQQVSNANTGILRALDKNTGRIQDIELSNGQVARMGRLSITMSECRYPRGNPSGNAYAFLKIVEGEQKTVAFEGWMIASSPALNPMDHPRYDVWVLRCKTS